MVQDNVFHISFQHFLLQTRSKTTVPVDQQNNQKSEYKRINQDQSLRIVQLEENLQKESSTIEQFSSNREMVQAALQLADGRVQELSMTASSRESVLREGVS